MAITKTEFINRMAKKGGITKVEANKRADAFIETLIDCLEEDGAVKFVVLVKKWVGRLYKSI